MRGSPGARRQGDEPSAGPALHREPRTEGASRELVGRGIDDGARRSLESSWLPGSSSFADPELCGQVHHAVFDLTPVVRPMVRMYAYSLVAIAWLASRRITSARSHVK